MNSVGEALRWVIAKIRSGLIRTTGIKQVPIAMISWVTNYPLILARNISVAMVTFGAKFLDTTLNKPKAHDCKYNLSPMISKGNSKLV